MAPDLNYLAKTILMRGHNISVNAEMLKMFPTSYLEELKYLNRLSASLLSTGPGLELHLRRSAFQL